MHVKSSHDDLQPTLHVLDGHMMDHLIEVKDDGRFPTLGIDPKDEYLGMNPPEWEALHRVAQTNGLMPTVRVGGSGANTARGFARLGGRAYVYGQVGSDAAGRQVIDQLHVDECEVGIRLVQGATGRCLVFVRPNGKRVMRSDVGVVMDFDDTDALAASIRFGSWLHLTGYLLDPTFAIHRVAWAAMEGAARQQVPISLDIGSGAYLARELGREVIQNVVENYPTVMFLNDTEAQELKLGSPVQAAAELLQWAHRKPNAIVVVTQGEHGVLAARVGEKVHVPKEDVVVRDTTGAGDAFVAGFLYALMQEKSLETCARLGCHEAAKVIQVLGGVAE